MLVKRRSALSLLLCESNSTRLLAALMRFSYDLKLSQMEVNSVLDIEQNCGKHISLVNDVYSYEKEKLISEKESFEGAILCNAVDILANQVSIPIEAAKSVLWIMVRECEFVHQSLMDRKNNTFPGLSMKNDLRRYVEGLEYQMSGNELWSKTTHRYRSIKAEFEQKQKMPASSNLAPTKRSMDVEISAMRSGDLSFQEEGSNMLHDRRYDSVISATVWALSPRARRTFRHSTPYISVYTILLDEISFKRNPCRSCCSHIFVMLNLHNLPRANRE